MAINLEKYFDSKDHKYYDARLLISILEKELGKSISEIRDDVYYSCIFVSGKIIEKFLDKKCEEEHPGLMQRVANPVSRCDKPFGEWTEQDIINFSQRFGDEIDAARYQFHPDTLEYFTKYVGIVREKAMRLLTIIELIATRCSHVIYDVLTELDIQLDENGNITREDIIRLLTPTIQNLDELYKKVTEANDLSTYLINKKTKLYYKRLGLSMGEVYPTRAIFVKNLLHGYGSGNVPISSRQEKELREKYAATSRKIAARILTSVRED